MYKYFIDFITKKLLELVRVVRLFHQHCCLLHTDWHNIKKNIYIKLNISSKILPVRPKCKILKKKKAVL